MERLSLLFLIFLLTTCDEGIGGDNLEERYRLIKAESHLLKDLDSYSLYVECGDGGSGDNIIGKKDGYESRVILWFGDQFDSLDNFSMNLVIYTDSFISPSPCSLFYVEQIWEENKVTWKTPNGLEKWEMGGGKSIDSLNENFITRFILEPESTVIEIPEDKIERFKETYGFLIVPEDGMDFIKIPGRESERSPVLIIKTDDEENKYQPAADAYMVDFDSTDIMKIMDWNYMGAGFGFRTYIEVPFDSIASDYVSVRLRVFYSEDYGINEDTFQIRGVPTLEKWRGRYTGTDDDVAGYGYLYPDLDYFDLDIKGMVDSYISDDKDYRGVVMQFYPENAGICRIKIDSIKLRIFYEEPPEERF